MRVAQSKRQEGRLSLPCILLTLSLLAMLVSLVGLQRATSITNERLDELQNSWNALQDGPIEGAKLVETGRLMDNLSLPIPAATSAAQWSLALAVISLLFVFWLMMAVRKDHRENLAADIENAEGEKQAIIRLTEEVAPLSTGDLRISATVDQNMTGPLADGFNHAASELRWLVTTITSSSNQLRDSVENCRETGRLITGNANRQSEQIHQSSNFLLSMAGSLAELSSGVSEQSSAARAIVDKSKLGSAELVQLQGSCRSGEARMNEIGSVMSRLEDTLRSIDEQILAVQDVSRRTELLALNTTIRMSAGAEGTTEASLTQDTASSIGKLSDEVAQMADLLSQAIREIESSSRHISQEVVATRHLVDQAKNQTLDELDAVDKLSELIDSIVKESGTVESYLLGFAETTVTHSGVVSQLTENLDVLNRITQGHVESVRSSEESLEELVNLADELQAAVVEFKLPGKAVSTVQAKPAVSAARRAADRAVIHG